MATCRFPCARCGAPVVAETDVQSVVCRGCGALFHATSCENCDEPFLAVDTGRQICPACGERQWFDADRLRLIGGVGEPLVLALAGRPPLEPPGRAVEDNDLDGLGSTLTWILSLAAVAVAGIGLWLTVYTATVLRHVHANVVLGVVEIGGATVVSSSVLAALALLVEQTAIMRRQLTNIERRLEPVARGEALAGDRPTDT